MKQLDQEGMKVVFAEITDFKGIKHSLIRFDGKSAYLIGGNGKGKSSVIDALMSPVDSSFIPQEPIKKGAVRGSINIRIAGVVDGQYEEYTIDTVFTPSKRTGILSMMNKDGEPVKNPKTKLKDMFGKNSFDIYEFMRSSKIEQIKTLKKLTGAEDVINELDEKRKQKAVSRMVIEKEIASAEAISKNENRPFTNEDVDKYSDPVNEQALMDELSHASEMRQEMTNIANSIRMENERLERVKSEAKTKLNQIDNLKKEIELLEEQVQVDRNTYKDISDNISKLNNMLSSMHEDNYDEVLSKLSQAKEHNRMHSIIESYRQRQLSLNNKRNELESVQSEIEDIDRQKIKAIEESQLPVKGLTFTEDEIYLDGLPFSSGQLNTQRILDVAAEISMAMNRRLKLVMIREGSLFDKEHLKNLLEKLNEKGYQWIVEWVDTDGGDLQIRFEEEDPLLLNKGE
jgi:DNA repair exonuclease SbcCD ATPase subunit